jgi:hypothetical protein
MIRLRDAGEIAAGLIVIGFALAVLWISRDLPLGTPTRPGPGASPVICGALMIPLGLAMLFRGLTREGDPVHFGNFRRIGFPLLGLLLFALLIERLGLAVATPVLVATASLADENARPIEILVAAIAITAFVLAVFAWLLELQIKVFPW